MKYHRGRRRIVGLYWGHELHRLRLDVQHESHVALDFDKGFSERTNYGWQLNHNFDVGGILIPVDFPLWRPVTMVIVDIVSILFVIVPYLSSENGIITRAMDFTNPLYRGTVKYPSPRSRTSRMSITCCLNSNSAVSLEAT